MNIQEQEHIDHVAGSASEFQNCYEEAGHQFAVEQAKENGKIARAKRQGRVVVCRQHERSCRATDGFLGWFIEFDSAWATRQAAEAYAEFKNRSYFTSDGAYFIKD